MKLIKSILFITFFTFSGLGFATTETQTQTQVEANPTAYPTAYQGDTTVSSTASQLMDDVWEMVEKVIAMGQKVVEMANRIGEMTEKMGDMTDRMSNVADSLGMESPQAYNEESAAIKQKATEKPSAMAQGAVQSGFFDSIFDMMVGEPIKAMAQAIAKAMEPVIDGVMDMAGQIHKMSLKIGQMADNILVMADRIGEMAEYILNMADRIVIVQQNMADLVAYLGGADAEKHYLGLALNEPQTGSTVSASTAPVISLSNNNVSSYILYASNSPAFANGETLRLKVTNEASLQTAWEEAMAIAADQSIYIAVKAVDNNNSTSELSNGVLLNLTGL